MTKIVVRVFISVLFVFGKTLIAQTTSMFEQAHHQLLNDYVAFIDSVEKKQPIGSYFEIHKRKHVSFVEFSDADFVYKIEKKIKVYKNGTRYEKIDWTIRHHHRFWPHKIYEIKQVGHDYRFIEQINYTFGKKLKATRMTTSIDDNYVRVRVLSPDDHQGTHLYIKANSSLPVTHQD